MPEHWSNAVSDIINTLQSARNSSQVKFWYNENLLVCMVQIKCSHTPLVALPDWLTHPGCNFKLSKIGYRHWEFWNNTNGKVPGWEWNGKKIMDKSTCLLTAVISHTRPPTIFFPFQKLRFGGRQSNVSMTITASGVTGTDISMSILRVFELLFHLYLTRR